MAGASEERPAEVQVTAQPPAGPSLGPVMPSLETEEAYRPLSLLEIAGLALAVLYCLCVLVGGLAPFALVYPRAFVLLLVLVPPSAALAAVLSHERRPGRIALFVAAALAGLVALLGLGGLVAFSSSKPWILPPWTWVLCGTALLLCWLALSRIRDSEGALSGQALAQWGLRLSLFIGGLYAFYLFGNGLAVRNQAAAAGNEFLDLIRQGDLDQAFLRTLKPGARPVGRGEALREALQTVHNVPRGPSPGAYSAFRMADYVQFLRMSGQEASYKLLSASQEFKEGSYQVDLKYEVQTVVGSFTMTFLVQSVDLPGERRRDWFVNPNRPIHIEDKKPTPEGENMERTTMHAFPVVFDWQEALKKGDVGRAYLDTLPEDQRERQRRAWLLAGGAVPLAPAALRTGADVAAFDKGLQAFTEARLLDLTDAFWSLGERDRDRLEQLKKEILGKVKSLFTGKAGELVLLDLVKATGPPPLERLEGNRVRIRFPAQIRILAIPAAPHRYGIECQIEVEGPFATGTTPPSNDYRVRALRLLRAGSGPADQMMRKEVR